jgi:polynucleotide 5'-hydroxyl-kinase GRC3/NOL9
MDILPEWETIEPAKLRGTLLVVGMSDAGKSTFARYLYGRLRQADRRVAYLDGDPGQGRLGPPATMTLTSEMIGEEPFRDQGAICRTFVGSTSPAGHMLPVLSLRN